MVGRTLSLLVSIKGCTLVQLLIAGSSILDWCLLRQRAENMTNLLKEIAVELGAYMAVSLKNGEPTGFICPDLHLC